MEASSDQPGLVYLARRASQQDLTEDWRLGNVTGFGCNDSSTDDTTTGRSRSTPRSRHRTRSKDRDGASPEDMPTTADTPERTPRSSTSRGTPRQGTPRRRTPTESEEDRSKRMTNGNEFRIYHGVPIISTIVEPVLEPVEVTAGPSEGPENDDTGSGEQQEQGETGADLDDIMIPTGLGVGLLLVAAVTVTLALVFFCYWRARQTHTKDVDNIDINKNNAYSLSSSTSPLPDGPDKERVGRKPPIKPRPRYAMNDNTAYGTTPEEWGVLQQHSVPHYITPKNMGFYTKTVARDHHMEKCEDNVYIVDGKIYEIPSEM